MRAEPTGGYWVIGSPTEITGHLVIGAHIGNINRDTVNLLEVRSEIWPEKDRGFSCRP
jgi:hypothetical protein